MYICSKPCRPYTLLNRTSSASSAAALPSAHQPMTIIAVPLHRHHQTAAAAHSQLACSHVHVRSYGTSAVALYLHSNSTSSRRRCRRRRCRLTPAQCNLGVLEHFCCSNPARTRACVRATLAGTKPGHTLSHALAVLVLAALVVLRCGAVAASAAAACWWWLLAGYV